MIIRCLEVRHLKFSSSVEYLRWRPSFLECRWVSPGGCHRAEKSVQRAAAVPQVPQATCFWGGWEFDSCGASPSRGEGGDWRGPRGAGPNARTVRNILHCEFQFWCRATGSHRMVFSRGRAEISSVFSSSKAMHTNTSKSPTIPEGIQCHFEEVGAIILSPLITVSGSWESWNHHQGSRYKRPSSSSPFLLAFSLSRALAWDEKAEPTILRYSIVIQINSWVNGLMICI